MAFKRKHLVESVLPAVPDSEGGGHCQGGSNELSPPPCVQCAGTHCPGGSIPESTEGACIRIVDRHTNRIDIEDVERAHLGALKRQLNDLMRAVERREDKP